MRGAGIWPIAAPFPLSHEPRPPNPAVSIFGKLTWPCPFPQGPETPNSIPLARQEGASQCPWSGLVDSWQVADCVLETISSKKKKKKIEEEEKEKERKRKRKKRKEKK
jgi:hypothetical protein